LGKVKFLLFGGQGRMGKGVSLSRGGKIDVSHKKERNKRIQVFSLNEPKRGGGKKDFFHPI